MLAAATRKGPTLDNAAGRSAGAREFGNTVIAGGHADGSKLASCARTASVMAAVCAASVSVITAAARVAQAGAEDGSHVAAGSSLVIATEMVAMPGSVPR